MPSDSPRKDFARPDWRRADDYAFCAALSVAQWAWEFLRRNPDYQRDWAWFDATWRALEAAYGRPPGRDFQAWRRDPRAWVDAARAGGHAPADRERVLIECWMGDKWGLGKFPLDPATDNPLPPERLGWRERRPPPDPTDPGCCPAWLDPHVRVAPVFELDLPLGPQLERIARWLKARQARALREGRLIRRARGTLAPRWTALLRGADALASGVGEERLPDALGVSAVEVRELIRGRGHLALLDVPDE